MLLLKRHLVALVRTGKKRQTIRLWSRPLLRPGQISYTPGLGKMRITAVEVLPSLAALNEADAIADGFPTLNALLAEIHKIYGKTIPAGRRIYRIKFHWPVDPHIPPALATPTAPGKKPPRRSTSSAPPIKNQNSKMKNPILPAQRQTLRAFILAQAPKR